MKDSGPLYLSPYELLAGEFSIFLRNVGGVQFPGLGITTVDWYYLNGILLEERLDDAKEFGDDVLVMEIKAKIDELDRRTACGTKELVIIRGYPDVLKSDLLTYFIGEVAHEHGGKVVEDLGVQPYNNAQLSAVGALPSDMSYKRTLVVEFM